MMAFARGPGKDVLITGTVIKFKRKSQKAKVLPSTFLFLLPPSTAGAVLENHSPPQQPVADPIGFPEIAAPARRMPLLDQPLDLLDGDRRLLVLGAAQAQDAQHSIEAVKRVA